MPALVGNVITWAGHALLPKDAQHGVTKHKQVSSILINKWRKNIFEITILLLKENIEKIMVCIGC